MMRDLQHLHLKQREVLTAKGRWHKFDGTKWHGVTPVKGHRSSFVYFNSEALDKLSEDDW
eukprot:6251427-Prorocentrum_lima.AAC.1